MIYYTSASGQIIGGTAGSDLTGITHLPSGSEYAVFIGDGDVESANPNNEPGTYTITNLTPAQVYSVPTATGTITFTAQPASEQLASAQQAKLSQLQVSFGQSLYQGFQSSADGTQRTYAIDPVAMSKWSAMLSVINAGKGPTSVTIKDFSGNQVNLTIAQFQNMAADGFNFFNNQELHLWNLETQVNDATTVDEVNKVTW